MKRIITTIILHFLVIFILVIPKTVLSDGPPKAREWKGKDTKNVNAAVRAEELRGKVAGFYIDKQIIASAKLIELPDGSKKAEPDLTESDYESMLMNLAKRHKIVSNKSHRKRVK